MLGKDHDGVSGVGVAGDHALTDDGKQGTYVVVACESEGCIRRGIAPRFRRISFL